MICRPEWGRFIDALNLLEPPGLISINSQLATRNDSEVNLLPWPLLSLDPAGFALLVGQGLQIDIIAQSQSILGMPQRPQT